MKKLRWQLIIIFLTGLVVGILLLAEQPAAQPGIAPEPVKGGIYTEALVGSVKRLNPVLDFNNPADHDINRLIFSGLLRFDGRGVPQKDMVETWGVSKDGTLYNLTLRPGMLWHDGKPVTSDDVLFTIDLLRNGGSVVPADIQNLWKNVKVKSLSETTLQFQLPEPFAPFLDYLTFGVLPKHLLNDQSFDELTNSPFNLQPVGSGPYRFDRLISENGQITGVVLAAFNKYYDKKPYIDQIVFRLYPESAVAMQAYRDGAVQGISEISDDILKSALAEQNLAFYSGRKPELAIILFNLKNTEKPFFQDATIRKTLLMGLNRQWMIDHILNGQAFIATGPIFPDSWAFYSGLKQVDFDADAAKNILKNAGYVLSGEKDTVRQKDKVELSFKLIYPDDDLHRKLAEAIQKDWANLNVGIELEAVPYDQLVNDRLGQRDFEAALVDLNLARTPDPDPYPFWDQAQATGGQNYSQWDNRVASEYLEQARITIDMDERIKLYRNFQVIFDDELPALPLFYPVYTYAVDKQVQGVRMGPLIDRSDRMATILDWFLVTKRPTPGFTQTPGK
ncbi:MAG: peptide ABC transporter substrate-binding protein [Bacteroidetes bacterium]|nr:peptide ABC transporter substrate-binding protein [Bacteroidota bacterium]